MGFEMLTAQASLLLTKSEQIIASHASLTLKPGFPAMRGLFPASEAHPRYPTKIAQSPSGWHTKLPQNLSHFALTLSAIGAGIHHSIRADGRLIALIGLSRFGYFMEMS